MRDLLSRTARWFVDLARIAFLPSDPTLRKIISRNRRFGEVLPLLLLTLVLSQLIAPDRLSIERVFRNLAISVFLVPAWLIVYAMALRIVIRNPQEFARHHEAFFHIGALAVSAGFLAGSLLAVLPVPFGLVLTVPLILHFLVIVVGRGIHLVMDIPFGRALGINLISLFLTIPLFLLCMAFSVLLPGGAASVLW